MIKNTYEIVIVHTIFSGEGVDVFHFYDQKQGKHILVRVSYLTSHQIQAVKYLEKRIM